MGKKTYAAVMDDMSKKLNSYEKRLADAKRRGDMVGIQDFGRRVERMNAGINTLFQTQESNKPAMGHGGKTHYAEGGVVGVDGMVHIGGVDGPVAYDNTGQPVMAGNNAPGTAWDSPMLLFDEAGTPMADVVVGPENTSSTIGQAATTREEYDALMANAQAREAAAAQSQSQLSAPTSPIGPPNLTVTPDPRRVPVGQQLPRERPMVGSSLQEFNNAMNSQVMSGGVDETAAPNVQRFGPLDGTQYPPHNPVNTPAASSTSSTAGAAVASAPQPAQPAQPAQSMQPLQARQAVQPSSGVMNPGANPNATIKTASDPAAVGATSPPTQGQPQGGMQDFLNMLAPEPNKLAQYGQYLPDLYSMYQMNQTQGPINMPSQTMARQNTDLNYNSVYAGARQNVAAQEASLDRNISNPVVRAAMKRSARNQQQQQMGQTMTNEINQERQLQNQYAQSIANNQNVNRQIATQNQQRQLDFANERKAANASLAQGLGTKMSQQYGENQNRNLDLQKMGISALQYDGDLMQRMQQNLTNIFNL